MAVLAPDLRNLLDKAVVSARKEAERAAEAGIRRLGVEERRPSPLHSEGEREIRNALRAKARQLGGDSFRHGVRLVVEEVAYGDWHRMLFARFLAENRLLMHPQGVPVTIQECAELAAAAGEPDGWALAARYAGRMLPGIFRPDDPCSRVPLAPEGRAALERIIEDLPREIFVSDDGLGWVYQFWQSARKKAVSGSEQKIEGRDLAAYSQLFTEDYMVRFLLENSLGAWWASRHPESPLLDEFKYLRRLDDGTPAAGTFPGWPAEASKVTVMDPCCGSGHFLVAAFDMLRRMRMEEEDLDAREAAQAVLRDNIFGLELDPRCVQIAAFSLALAAWKASGYWELPLPNLACSGIPLSGRAEEWTRLAEKDGDLRYSLARLHQMFQDAPHLGSLINPASSLLQDDMFVPDFAKIEPLLNEALANANGHEDPVATAFGAIARGAAHAAELLVGRYNLVATNVPYLASGRHGDVLKSFLLAEHQDARTDIATAFVERCLTFADPKGACALVAPHNWSFLKSYAGLRERLLGSFTWNWMSPLGPGAFGTISGEVVKVALSIVTCAQPPPDHVMHAVDASGAVTVAEKAACLRENPIQAVPQAQQRRNPGGRILFDDLGKGPLLSTVAASYQGIKTGDDPRFRRRFWEVRLPSSRWRYLQTTVAATEAVGGLSGVLDWLGEGRILARKQGLGAWGKRGVAVSLMGKLKYALYSGEAFDSNMAALVPHDPSLIDELWAFCSSGEFTQTVRKIDSKVNVTNGSLTEVPFDRKKWENVARKRGPLPELQSQDPTQWVFSGDPSDSTAPLQVAVARLLGYRWPEEPADDGLSRFADPDGLVPIPPLAGDRAASERLRTLLMQAYEPAWSPALEGQLLQGVGFGGEKLEDWLRSGFFSQHVQLFGQRPFIWHIWDGLPDGFAILANYHMLDGRRLERLIYTYLGEWLRNQQVARDAGVEGAATRVDAALELQRKLKAIRDGEEPYDIFVRWKPLREQPMGWEPDVNDGVLINIRPFIEAGVLRSRVKGARVKDRGLDPDGVERRNDRHVALERKRAAREAAEA